MRGKRGAFLPQALVAQMLAGEDDRTFGLQQLVILRSASRDAAWASAPSGPRTLRIGDEAPGDGDSPAEQLRASGVQGFDRFAADSVRYEDRVLVT